MKKLPKYNSFIWLLFLVGLVVGDIRCYFVPERIYPPLFTFPGLSELIYLIDK